MKREYRDGTADDVLFFVGYEVEKTPALNLQTLFVVGAYDVDFLEQHIKPEFKYGIEHIYLGANQSFDPGDWTNGSFESTDQWATMIEWFLNNFSGFVTLDFDVKHIQWVADGGFTENHRFIPQISIKLPYIELLGYNATIKLDDIDFNKTNPGVWCHHVHDLKSRSAFTNWTEYGQDRTLMTRSQYQEKIVDSSMFKNIIDEENV